jgi:hypothetical protein
MNESIVLSPSHQDAVNRRRRIIVQYDAADRNMTGMDFKTWLEFRFDYIDESGTQIDSLWWDISLGNDAVYPSKVLRPDIDPGIRKLQAAGIDWVKVLVEECHKRGKETFWNARISEVENDTQGLEMKNLFPEKAAHPDWVIKTWWWQGMWNLASPGLREYKLSILRELAENYEFDGFQIDFARHVPCLPVGRQWELRENVTEFVRMVRRMLLEVEAKRGRPILLSTKVPENLEGCRIDGFDVETWAKENLVDMFTLGSRTMDVDVEAFRGITAGKNIKLYPCFDDHHATDGYRYPPIEVFRGIYGNWWQQGADGVETFNWSNASPECCARFGAEPGPLSQRQAYHEVGSPETLKDKDKTYVVERRGGYPWAEGYFNQNLTSPLPAVLAYDGRPARLTVRVADNLVKDREKIRDVTLNVTLFGAVPGDRIEIEWNGSVLENAAFDFDWKDGQIFSPKPQRISGGDGKFPIDPDQKLLRISLPVLPERCRQGKNDVGIRIVKQTPYCCREIQVEKIELHTRYRG